MTAPRRLALALLVGAVGAIAVLSGCSGAPDGAATTGDAGAATSAASSATPAPQATIAPFPIGASTSTTPLPADLPQGCRDILTGSVLAQLEGVPLNAEGMGGGIRPDSSRVCVWGEPGAVATRLVTVIGYSPEREARDALYELGNEGYTCYEPDGGIRCEKTWEHPTLPGVTEGRTLFYRDGVIVDTQYTNLAPKGYTAAIIDYLWPAVPRTATPTAAPTP
ncbi:MULTISPECIES: hypothetical protein [Microbacterium]|uniref:DUF3558 domain-containing protein n=1 Tax=Microbacterium aurum TaxID=36805 RepID=A0A1P8UB48_9MICO|nr:hypothetical protein [Microbacterium aurum]APZ35306.1 hypothetical protein BOH66_14375 [Microbacterium aurum]MBM7829292.1 hypothetical protein [Microbacterium aurum]